MKGEVNLALRALAAWAVGAVVCGTILFASAGTLDFPDAWVFFRILFELMFLFGVVLFLKAPELLEKRLNNRESEPAQRTTIRLSALMFAAGFIVAGLDFRFGWSHVPAWGTVLSVVVFLAGFALYVVVAKENAFLSRTVEVQDGQGVVDTGLYGIVRHPMYSATLLMFWATPFILGSPWAFLAFIWYPLLLVKRIRNEEAVLAEGLPGYAAYRNKVRWRLIPFVW